jgi:DNA invertase Pin-like site-specific DNA recombinase
MFLTVLAAFGELERGLISERTKMAIAYLKQNHKRFTKDIYGWDCDDDGNLTSNQGEQKWIDWMRVQYFDEDTSASEIARMLNDKGIPSKRGKNWTHTSVLRTIKCEFHNEARLIDG